MQVAGRCWIVLAVALLRVSTATHSQPSTGEQCAQDKGDGACTAEEAIAQPSGGMDELQDALAKAGSAFASAISSMTDVNQDLFARYRRAHCFSATCQAPINRIFCACVNVGVALLHACTCIPARDTLHCCPLDGGSCHGHI